MKIFCGKKRFIDQLVRRLHLLSIVGWSATQGFAGEMSTLPDDLRIKIAALLSSQDQEAFSRTDHHSRKLGPDAFRRSRNTARLIGLSIEQLESLFSGTHPQSHPYEVEIGIDQMNLEVLKILPENLKSLEVMGRDSSYAEFSEESDLTNLSRFKNLTHLKLIDLDLKNFSPLADLTQLTHLSLHSSKIKDATPLLGLHRLVDLDISNTQIRDSSGLSGLRDLRSIRMSPEHLNEAFILALPTGIKEVRIIGEYIGSSLSLLSRFKDLEKLDLSCLTLENVSLLKALPNLKKLNLSSVEFLSDYLQIASLTQLTELSLSGTKISDTAFLTPLVNLVKLDLSYTKITEISDLESLSKLSSLRLKNSKISVNKETEFKNKMPRCLVSRSW